MFSFMDVEASRISHMGLIGQIEFITDYQMVYQK